MKATTIIGGIALGAVGLVAKKWLDGEVEKARELYGDDYTVTESFTNSKKAEEYNIKEIKRRLCRNQFLHKKND